jgi:hypothetical protein
MTFGSEKFEQIEKEARCVRCNTKFEAHKAKNAARGGDASLLLRKPGGREVVDANITVESMTKAGARIARGGDPKTSVRTLETWIRENNLAANMAEAARQGYRNEVGKNRPRGGDAVESKTWVVTVYVPQKEAFRGVTYPAGEPQTTSYQIQAATRQAAEAEAKSNALREFPKWRDQNLKIRSFER